MACFHHPGMTLNLLERGKMKIIVWKPTNNNPQRVISNTTISILDVSLKLCQLDLHSFPRSRTESSERLLNPTQAEFQKAKA